MARETPHSLVDMVRHTFDAMPEGTETQRRDKVLIAFLMLKGARDGAIASLPLKYVNTIDGYVFQHAREVRTKGLKTIMTYFLPVDPIYEEFFVGWVCHLHKEKPSFSAVAKPWGFKIVSGHASGPT